MSPLDHPVLRAIAIAGAAVLAYDGLIALAHEALTEDHEDDYEGEPDD